MHTTANAGLTVVTVKKDELISRIKANLEKHRVDYAEALEKFKAFYVESLKRCIANAEAGKRWKTTVHIYKPTSHVKEYERVIDMLEMSQDDLLDITMQEFDQYVRDEWNWKQQFNATVQSYSAGRDEEEEAE